MGSLACANTVGFMCRICLELHKVVLHVFGDHGLRLQLPQKIAACMTANISVDDCLPKTICLACIERVNLAFAKLSVRLPKKAISAEEINEFPNQIVEWHIFTTTSEPGIAINVNVSNASPQLRRVFAFMWPPAASDEGNVQRLNSIW